MQQIEYHNPYLHRICTRRELIDWGLFSAYKLRRLKHRDRIIDRKGHLWEVIRKERLHLEWHDFYGVKVLFKGV